MTARIAAPIAMERPSDSPARALRAGGTVAGAFFVGLLGWAATIPLDSGAHAEGVLSVSGNRKAVQTRDGGVVTEIAAQDGQKVRAGELLVRIAATETRATERGLASEMVMLLAQRARLLAERDRRPSMPVPPEFAVLPPEDRALAAEALALQQRQFAARRGALDTQRDVLGQRIRQLGEQTTGTSRRLGSNRQQQGLMIEELDAVKELADKGYAPKTRVLALKRNVAALDGEFGAFQSDVGRIREAMSETRLEILSLDRERDEEIARDLRDTQARIDEIAPRLAAAREQLERASIRAPAAGRVIASSVFTVGGVASPGQTLMEIVPQDQRLVVQAHVSPDDADDLMVGQTAQLRLTGLHERDLPLLSGTLARLSADRLTDERSGTAFFLAEISVELAELNKVRQVRGIGTGLQAGLPVEILIPLRKRTALTYLLEPLAATFWRTGREH